MPTQLQNSIKFYITPSDFNNKSFVELPQIQYILLYWYSYKVQYLHG